MKRKLLILGLLFLSSAHILAQNKEPELAEGLTEVHDLFNTSMNPAVSCYRIPAIVTATNGDLVVAIDERVPSCNDLRGSGDINIVIRRSQDHGKSWSEIEKIVDLPEGKSASDPSMIVDQVTSEIFLFYNFMDLEKEPGIYYLHVIKSSDHGKSWSEAEDITSQIAKSQWHKDFKFITSGRGIQTRSGKLLHCMVNLDHGLHLFGSDDHGKSWHLIDTALKPGNESKVVELEDGRWMVNCRANGRGIRYVHVSSDQGISWDSRPEPELIDPGCNGSIIRYTSTIDGYQLSRLLFSNAKMKKGRENMTVRISYDEGLSWTEGKTIYPGGSAYSSLTVLENGDIGLFFEKNDYTENVFVSFSLEWLTDGADHYEKPQKN
ncbi:MAG: exo-alpha-sialidase [Bacteroidetes bacterium]|nr:MAG: exo-alpha-sialidase [Bacteroidota bacterium]RLD97150.1 MAG: exo-alpha-sialidase [Bacteroidota bacterium]